MQAAVFLDRDGVIVANREDYVKRWEEVEFLEGALEALQRLAVGSRPIVMVTNQSAVGRGILSYEEAVELNQRIIETVEAHGGRIDAAYLCPHHPADQCDCRKPAPGMLLRAAKELNLDLAASFLVGDALTDLQAAERASAQGILVLTGRGSDQLHKVTQQSSDCPVVADLAAAVDYILAREM
jgi:D-glycero-D-manno-heptose 1,7-bisphosphate phosphatase